MLALVAMEQPLSFDAEDIRAEKLKVLRAVKPLKLCDLVTGLTRDSNLSSPLLSCLLLLKLPSSSGRRPPASSM